MARGVGRASFCRAEKRRASMRATIRRREKGFTNSWLCAQRGKEERWKQYD